ncbi:MAG: ATP-grasp domain-containing protein [Myxococcales bacterium]|nr:ATP-grasp domain-containing protein [Myxococcales bacterium]
MRRIGIVNRGEPAIRFLNALDALRREKPAPAAVALYTRPDTDSLYVRSADAAICIGEGRAAYLDAGAVIAALRETGCDGAWLGWGFASEDAAFCTALEDAGITLLAPRPDSMARLGDKVAAKRLAEEYGVPVAAWAVVRDATDALAAAERVGYPLMIKAAGGGGGRGIRRVEGPDALPALFAAVRAEADRSFHGGDIFIERCVDGARHVEVQVLGDGAGRVLVYGVRECSLQRRRQKIVEECPSVGLSEEARALLVASAERLCAAVAYRSAGTVEFLYDDRTDRACFLEVNSRLQVEHPVTEEVYGADLVRAQIELALGEPLPPAVAAPRGWAIEARVCAEDPHNDFAPAPGRLVRFVLPTGPGLRVDTGFSEGETISSDFDPLVAKVIAWGADRGVALARLAHALDQTRIVVEGGTTNLAFLRALLARDDVRAGRFDVGTVDRLRVEAPPGQGVAALAAAIDRFLAAGDEDDSRGPDRHRVEAGDALAVYRLGPDRFRVLHESGEVTVHYEADGPYQRWLSIGGARHRVERVVGDRSYVVDGTPHRVAAAGAGAVAAPSAAVVLDVLVVPGDRVEAGQTVAVLESMKMEVRVDTPRAGEVREVFVTAGGQVRAGQVMLLIDAEGTATVAEPATTGIPWQAGPPAAEAAAERLRAAFTGWDAPPGTLRGDAAHVDPQDFAALLGVFADVAELLERRPDRQPDGGEGATDAVSPALWIETLRRQGQDALAARPRIALARALAHHGVALDAAPAVVDDALRRLARAELSRSPSSCPPPPRSSAAPPTSRRCPRAARACRSTCSTASPCSTPPASARCARPPTAPATACTSAPTTSASPSAPRSAPRSSCAASAPARSAGTSSSPPPSRSCRASPPPPSPRAASSPPRASPAASNGPAATCRSSPSGWLDGPLSASARVTRRSSASSRAPPRRARSSSPRRPCRRPAASIWCSCHRPAASPPRSWTPSSRSPRSAARRARPGKSSASSSCAAPTIPWCVASWPMAPSAATAAT